MQTELEFEKWFNTWDGKCPACSNEPLKKRRSRCPICKEWIEYEVEHAGHKLPHWDNGKVKWRKPIFKTSGLAWIGHMNAHQETHSGRAFVDTFYEKAD